MPALKKTRLTEAFTGTRQIGEQMGEVRDCTVVAMSITTGLSYEVCREALAKAGRRDKRGACWAVQAKAYESLGFWMRRWTSSEYVAMVVSYPKKGIHGITTHQPRRFAKQWAGTGRLTLHSRGHVSACVDGVVHDWAINRSKQVVAIHSIVPMTDEEKKWHADGWRPAQRKGC